MNQKIEMGIGIPFKKPRNEKVVMIAILTWQNKALQNQKVLIERQVKIGICGSHHHPSDPFLFLEQSLFSFQKKLFSLYQYFLLIYYGSGNFYLKINVLELDLKEPTHPPQKTRVKKRSYQIWQPKNGC